MTAPQHAARTDRHFGSYAEFYRNSAYAAFNQDHRVGGTFGLTMLQVEQERIDLIDAPLPELVIQYGTFAPGVASVVSLDVGYGLRESQGGFGKITVAPADVAVRYRISKPHTAHCFALPKQSLAGIVESYDLGADCLDPLAGGFSDNPQACALMQRLWVAGTADGAIGSLYFDSLVLQLVAMLANTAGQSIAFSPFVEDARIARVVDYIETHYGGPLNIGELAAVACLSPGHFSRTFKATTGEAVWAYVQRRRLERARDMLLTTPCSISEIAYRCGFASQAHLTRGFSREFGITPGALRKQ